MPMDQGQRITVLQCGRTVPTPLYESVRNRVLLRAAELKDCKPYTAKMICGEQFWNGLGGHKAYAGLIMAGLVDQQHVPFQFASDRHDKPLWYRLDL